MDVSQTPVIPGQPSTVTMVVTLNSGQSFPVKFLVPPGTQGIQGIQGAQGVNSTPVDGSPIGTILSYAFSTVPDGYLLLNGATFDQTKYATLYNQLGSNTLPDARGMFLRGLDPSGNIDRDGATRKLLQFQEGSRLLNDYGWSAIQFGVNSNYSSSYRTSMANLGYDPRANTSQIFDYYAASQSSHTTAEGLSNSSNAFDMVGIARPKNLAVNYIIKAL